MKGDLRSEGALSFVFYDTETTGIDTSFDQILQFAAIRTDENLRELERFEIRCRMQDRVLASPGALKVTGVTVAQLTDSTLPSHYEMIRSIYAKLDAWSPAIFIGYNSIKFDENLLRSALWKTLHRPYLTNTDGNGRADALGMVQAMAAIRPGVLNIPADAKGKSFFKLDAVAPLNGFDHRKAHDALADVEATIHLCKIIAEKSPALWSRFVAFAQKAEVVDFLTRERAFGLIEYYFGKASSAIVATIGRSSGSTADYYALDLSVDPAELRSLTDDALRTRLAKSPKPVRRVKANAAPLITSLDDAPEGARGRDLGIPELMRRAEEVGRDAALRKRIIAAVEAAQEPFEKSPYLEKQIYDGFASDADMKLADAFHGASWESRLDVARRIKDDRLQRLAMRVIFDERPDLLSRDECSQQQRQIAERLLSTEPDLPWATIAAAKEECRDLLESATLFDSALLSDYLAYLEERERQLSAML